MSEGRRGLLLLPSLAAYVGLFLAPIGFFFVLSFWSASAMRLRRDFTFDNYVETYEKYAGVILFTLGIGMATVLVTVTIAFLFAYAMRFKAGRFGPVLLFVTLITLFGGYLVKIYAWKSILGKQGILNSALQTLGLVDEPLTIFIYNPGAVVVTLTHFLLPLAVLPLYGAMRSLPDITLEAARDLGAGSWRAILDVVVPHCRQAILSAVAIVLLLAVGDYVTPRFVGGPYTAMLGDFIETQFSLRFDWPMGSAMSFSILAVSAALLLLAWHALRRATRR